MGVSYLAMSQWYVACLKPPHLCAIVPWEGATDMYREMAFHGGIPETKFVPLWFKNRIRRGRNRRFPLSEDFLEERERHPLDDEYWETKLPILENIEVPVLICASWSDQGLHTRGSIEAFKRVPSKQKWLFTHGRKKWETFYSDEALAYQKRFLDHFLLDLDNGQDRVRKVRLEIRKAFYQQNVRFEECWPLAYVQPLQLFLRADTFSLQSEPVTSESKVEYLSTSESGRGVFSMKLDSEVEFIGGMGLKLWVSTSEGDDLDLFVVVRKLDAAGHEVFFSGYNGYEHDSVAKGWLRVSHRELDEALSTSLQSWHKHARIQKVRSGDIVPVEIEILSSATLFEVGSTLQLAIQGHDAARYPSFGHQKLVNRGLHTVFTGGPHDSQLVVPLYSRSSP